MALEHIQARQIANVINAQLEPIKIYMGKVPAKNANMDTHVHMKECQHQYYALADIIKMKLARHLARMFLQVITMKEQETRAIKNVKPEHTILIQEDAEHVLQNAKWDNVRMQVLPRADVQTQANGHITKEHHALVQPHAIVDTNAQEQATAE